MATITSLAGLRHLSGEPTVHVQQFKRGLLKRSGRGLSFWFLPLVTSLAEVPCDDRDETFLFHGRSADFQDITTQGVISYRVVDPEELAKRIEFSIDSTSGLYQKTPLEKLSQSLIQAAQQHAWSYLAGMPVQELVRNGVEEVRERIFSGLAVDDEISAMGIEILAVRITDVAPTAELEKALQAPTHEALQEQADEAIFHRRALAVEKERAIQENELQNQIELSKREQELIVQQGINQRNRAVEQAEEQRIGAESEAVRQRLAASAKADSISQVERARVEAEGERMKIYREMPAHVLAGLAAREMAGKLERIENLNITPELLGPMLQRLVQAGTEHLKGGDKTPRN